MVTKMVSSLLHTFMIIGDTITQGGRTTLAGHVMRGELT